MPRQSRIDFPGALHHIIVRGIDRRTIFQDNLDYTAFIDRFGDVLKQTTTECLAWALLPNHFHLLLRTGTTAISSVMCRLLTGHATYFNRRHNRQGHLFQNRYKSILCQEDTYLLELVRYIHLNPLRAKLISNLDDLATYPFCGHGVILGNFQFSWQNSAAVLLLFGQHVGSARSAYAKFVGEGVALGRRDDLIGGGLIRSSSGWTAATHPRKTGIEAKSDERILGNNEFVDKALSQSAETLDRRYELQLKGVDTDTVARRVAELLGMDVHEIWQPGRGKRLVAARSLLCFWAVQELGESMTSMARRLGISTVAVSKAVQRGARLVLEQGYDLGDRGRP